MDLKSAKRAMTTLMKDPEKNMLLNAPSIYDRAKMSIQIAGVYSLIYTHIENNFPRRNEVKDYVEVNIQNNLNNHAVTKHDIFGGPGVPIPCVFAPLINENKNFIQKDGDDKFYPKSPEPENPTLNKDLYTNELLATNILKRMLDIKDTNPTSLPQEQVAQKI